EGIATPFFNTLLMAMIQQSYPSKQLGRVLGVLNSLMSLTGPIGLIFAGPLADAIGVEMLFVIAGVGTVICGLVAIMTPLMRTYDIELQKRLEAHSK
ncbi:MFS transporter, partial [Lactobacillus parabuchneri]|nr:MFS transporter [Lentilactobacillus parabuchneri]